MHDMKVKDLIEMLQKFNGELPVTFSDYDQADEEQIFSIPNGVEKLITDNNDHVVVIFKRTDF